MVTPKGLFGTESYRLRQHDSVLFCPVPLRMQDNECSGAKTIRGDLSSAQYHRGAIYASIKNTALFSLLETYLPAIRSDLIHKAKLAIAVEASIASLMMSTAAAINCQLIRRAAKLEAMRLNDETTHRARAAPFNGSGLMGPYVLKQEEAVHGRRTSHFKVPDKRVPQAKSRVWERLGEQPAAQTPAAAAPSTSGFDFTRLGQLFRVQGARGSRGGRERRGCGGNSGLAWLGSTLHG